jgi:hypothetical protein
MTLKSLGAISDMYTDLILILGGFIIIVISSLLCLCFTKSTGANTRFARKNHKQTGNELIKARRFRKDTHIIILSASKDL